MTFKNILFDLDGTLTDPKVGITKSAAHALKHFGIDADPDSLCHFIGPPLAVSFKNCYGFNDEQCDTAIRVYREYFSTVGKYENELYPKTVEILDMLKQNGHNLFIATSKPEVFAVDIAKHFGIFDYFKEIRGIGLGEEKIEKEVVIKRLVDQFELDANESVMIGDRCFDTIGAHQNKIKCVGVLYGYGDRTEFEQCNTDYIVQTQNDLYNFLSEIR